ncbi:MAG TPA: hypothetical protein VLJ16_13730, partial [Acidobacteriota bacterium]|nr:hypothetical protein [Acidobacteriota bacterium]
MALLREFFPLEFLHASRFLTFLSGFALAVTSLNIFKRKRRAYIAAMILSGSSVLFHLTKGLDYLEAASSAVLMAVLFLARDRFKVKSHVPDVRATLARLTIGLGAV